MGVMVVMMVVLCDNGVDGDNLESFELTRDNETKAPVWVCL